MIFLGLRLRQRLMSVHKVSSVRLYHSAPRLKSGLSEIGQFLQPQEVYQSGQFFIHRLHGYRGVVLSSWETERVMTNDDNSLTITPIRYYVALADERDYASQKDTCTYVSHNDIRPFKPSIPEPVEHRYYDAFLTQPARSSLLHKFTEQQAVLLKHSRVYVQETERIKVTALPIFMGKNVHYRWAYNITLEYAGAADRAGGAPVRLVWRHWHITDGEGRTHAVHGSGVVGQFPVLDRATPGFEYFSSCVLPTPSGTMKGTYSFQGDDQTTLLVRIPEFALESGLL